MPSFVNRSTTSGDVSALLIARFSVSITAFGVLAGAKKPNQPEATTLLSPSSLNVGTSGSRRRALLPVVARRRILPARYCSERSATVSIADGHLPADEIVHVRAGALVRDVHHVDADIARKQHADEMRQAARSRRRVRCFRRIRLWPTLRTLPTSSQRVPGPAASANWNVAPRPIAAKSFTGSNGIAFSVCGTTAIGPIGITMIVEPSGAAHLDDIRSDPPRRAGPVFDDHRLADRVLELVGDDARDEIRRCPRARTRRECARACPSCPARVRARQLPGARHMRQRGSDECSAERVAIFPPP